MTLDTATVPALTAWVERLLGALGLDGPLAVAGHDIGGALAQSQAQAAQPTYVVPDQSAVAYCSQRFRSYDPASGTYLGYDGVRRSCP